MQRLRNSAGIIGATIVCLVLVMPHAALRAADGSWGGHAGLRGRVAWPDSGSSFALVGLDPLYDGSAELRLKHTLQIGSHGELDLHYEMLASGGDTRRVSRQLARMNPALDDLTPPAVSDDVRLMRLTGTLEERDTLLWQHRLDRLSLALFPEWGTLRAGRQAITWGNGLIFNVMDISNPFAPTNVEREYKTGDDMLFTQGYLKDLDLQVIYVPRRDPETHNLTRKRSTLAAKLHGRQGGYEYDLLLAGHYDDLIVGGGLVGYAGSAVWRVDNALTFLRAEHASAGLAWALTANLDYSWVWWQKNFYGLLEAYYQSLPESGDYAEVAQQPAVADRLRRGELFTLGRAYLGGLLRVEFHPLVNGQLLVIANLADPSGIVRPRITWDAHARAELAVGGEFVVGAEGTEYGGFSVPGTQVLQKPPQSLYGRVRYYF